MVETNEHGIYAELDQRFPIIHNPDNIESKPSYNSWQRFLIEFYNTGNVNGKEEFISSEPGVYVSSGSVIPEIFGELSLSRAVLCGGANDELAMVVTLDAPGGGVILTKRSIRNPVQSLTEVVTSEVGDVFGYVAGKEAPIAIMNPDEDSDDMTLEFVIKIAGVERVQWKDLENQFEIVFSRLCEKNKSRFIPTEVEQINELKQFEDPSWLLKSGS